MWVNIDAKEKIKTTAENELARGWSIFQMSTQKIYVFERSFEDIRGSGAVNRVEMAFIRIISVFGHSGSIQASVKSEALIICWNGNSTSGPNYQRFRMINYFLSDYHHLNLNPLSENSLTNALEFHLFCLPQTASNRNHFPTRQQIGWRSGTKGCSAWQWKSSVSGQPTVPSHAKGWAATREKCWPLVKACAAVRLHEGHSSMCGKGKRPFSFTHPQDEERTKEKSTITNDYLYVYRFFYLLSARHTSATCVSTPNSNLEAALNILICLNFTIPIISAGWCLASAKLNFYDFVFAVAEKRNEK